MLHEHFVLEAALGRVSARPGELVVVTGSRFCPGRGPCGVALAGLRSTDTRVAEELPGMYSLDGARAQEFRILRPGMTFLAPIGRCLAGNCGSGTVFATPAEYELTVSR